MRNDRQGKADLHLEHWVQNKSTQKYQQGLSLNMSKGSYPPPPSSLIGQLAGPMKGAGEGAEMDLLPPPMPWPSSLALLPQLNPKKRRA